MADQSSRTLVVPPSGFSIPYGVTQNARYDARSRYKLPSLIILLLSTLVACIAAAIVILVTSHEDAVTIWRVQPSVWLSILAAIYTIALSSLFSTGVAVIWWRCIAHGTTLERLHYIYAGSTPKDLVAAFFAGSYAKKAAIASLLVFSTKLMVGPLLQCSTRQQLHEAARHIPMTAELASEIPDGWFDTGDPLGANALQTSQDTFFGRNVTTRNSPRHVCPNNGTCRAHVKGAGLNLSNTTSSSSLNLLDPANINQTLFSISLSMDDGVPGLPVLYLKSRFVSAIASNCVATVTTETYGMIPATMSYPVTIQGRALTPDIPAVIDNPAILSNYSKAANATTVLRGFMRVFQSTYTTEARLELPQEGKPATYTAAKYDDSISFSRDMFLDTSVFPGSGHPDNVVQYCPLLWHSPTKHVLGQILEFNFRASRSVASLRDDQHDRQNFTALYTGEELQHVTEFKWLAGSVTVMVLGMTAALLLSWGWWQLGRHVTLSPIETGKAFGAPILAQTSSAQEASSIVRAVGLELVAYDDNDDELIWAGSVYTTGVHPSPKNGTTCRPSRSSEEPRPHHVPPLDPVDSGHLAVRRPGRDVCNINGADPIRVTRAFEHDRGYTTRRPYDDEDQNDIDRHCRPWGGDQSNDNVPLIQLLSNIAAPELSWKRSTEQKNDSSRPTRT